jgi:hypothetical protein
LDVTPFELWYGWEPNINHLKIFGSTVYALIHKEKRDKFDYQTRRLIFVGYEEGTKSYRLLEEKCITQIFNIFNQFSLRTYSPL